MDHSKLILKKVEPDTVFKPFDCGDADLNGFLFDDSKNYLESMLAVTYLLEDTSEEKTIAYYCLLNDKIKIDPDEKSKWNKINRRIPNHKRHQDYPAVKIGRLGVSLEYAHQQIGRKILLQIKNIFSHNNLSGCRFLTVDAYRNAIPFYQKCGFNFLTDKDEESSTRAMYFDLATYKSI